MAIDLSRTSQIRVPYPHRRKPCRQGPQDGHSLVEICQRRRMSAVTNSSAFVHQISNQAGVGELMSSPTLFAMASGLLAAANGPFQSNRTIEQRRFTRARAIVSRG
jgi:hypothetical protein